MEFYKLFYLIHRRTDWVHLWRFERKMMMPEWYEQERIKSRDALKSLLVMGAMVDVLNTPYNLNAKGAGK